MKSKQFWILYVMQGMSILFCYYVVNVYKEFGEEIPTLDNDKYLTLVNSISAIFNALRFVWSGAIDKFPFRYIYGLLLLIEISIASTMYFSKDTKETYMLVICLVLFCVGGHFALFPNILRQIYGKQATQLYGWCFTATGIASILIEILIVSSIGSNYMLMFALMGSGSVVAFLLLIFVFDQKRFQPNWVLIFRDYSES